MPTSPPSSFSPYSLPVHLPPSSASSPRVFRPSSLGWPPPACVPSISTSCSLSIFFFVFFLPRFLRRIFFFVISPHVLKPFLPSPLHFRLIFFSAVPLTSVLSPSQNRPSHTGSARQVAPCCVQLSPRRIRVRVIRCSPRVSCPALPLFCIPDVFNFVHICFLLFFLSVYLSVHTAAAAANCSFALSPPTPVPPCHLFHPFLPIPLSSCTYRVSHFLSPSSLSPRPCSHRPPIPFSNSRVCSPPVPYSSFPSSSSASSTSPLCTPLTSFPLPRTLSCLSSPASRKYGLFFLCPSPPLYCRSVRGCPASSPAATGARDAAAGGGAEAKGIFTSVTVDERVLCGCASVASGATRAAAGRGNTRHAPLSSCVRNSLSKLNTSCLFPSSRRDMVGENSKPNSTFPLRAYQRGGSIRELVEKQRESREASSAAARTRCGRNFPPLSVSTRRSAGELRKDAREETVKRAAVPDSLNRLQANPQLPWEGSQKKEEEKDEEAADEEDTSSGLTAKLQQRVDRSPVRSRGKGVLTGSSGGSHAETLLQPQVPKKEEDQQQQTRQHQQQEQERQDQRDARQQQRRQRGQGYERQERQRGVTSNLVEIRQNSLERWTEEEREGCAALSKQAFRQEEEEERRTEEGGEEKTDVIDELEAWTLKDEERDREERLRAHGKGVEGILEAAKKKERRRDPVPGVYIHSARFAVKSDRCHGCGARLQSVDPSKPAYVPPALLHGGVTEVAAGGRSPYLLAAAAAVAAGKAPGEETGGATKEAERRGERQRGNGHEHKRELCSLVLGSVDERVACGTVVRRGAAAAAAAAAREKERGPAAKSDRRERVAETAAAGVTDATVADLAEEKRVRQLGRVHSAQAASRVISEGHLAAAAAATKRERETTDDLTVPTEAALAFDAAGGDPEKIASIAATAEGVDFRSFAAALAKALGVAEEEVVEKLSFACDYNEEEENGTELEGRNGITPANGDASAREDDAVNITNGGGEGETDAGDRNTDSGEGDTVGEWEWTQTTEDSEGTGDNTETDKAKGRSVEWLEAAATKAASPGWDSTGGKKRHSGVAPPQHQEGTSTSSTTAAEFSAANGGETWREEGGGSSGAREESREILSQKCGAPLLLREFEHEVVQPSAPQRQLICQRCHAITCGKKFDERLRVGFSGDRLLHPDTFRKLVGSLRTKRCIFLLLIDLLSPEVLPALPSLIRVNPLFVGVTKCDLLPGALRGTGRPREPPTSAAAAQNFQRQCVAHSGTVKRFVFDLLMKEAGSSFKNLSVKNIFPLSNRSGAGLTPLINALGKEAIRRKRTVYVIGAANAGKTSFLNNLLSKASDTGTLMPHNKPKGKGETEATAAACVVPGTTLDFLPVVINQRWKVVDTPGIFLRGTYPSMLSQEELQVALPSSSLHRISLSVKENEGVWLGSLARVELLKGRGCFVSFFLSRSLSLYPLTSKALQNEDLLEAQRRRLSPASSLHKLETLRPLAPVDFEVHGAGWRNTAADIVVSGLGWISLTGCGTLLVRLWAPQEVLAYQRSPLVPRATRACPPVPSGAVKLLTQRKIRPQRLGASVHDTPRNFFDTPSQATT